MRPRSQSDRHDGPGLVDEPVPSVAAMVDESVVGGEDAVGQPVVAQELPDVLLRVQLGALGRQLDDGDVGGHVELGRGVPAAWSSSSAAW